MSTVNTIKIHNVPTSTNTEIKVSGKLKTYWTLFKTVFSIFRSINKDKLKIVTFEQNEFNNIVIKTKNKENVENTYAIIAIIKSETI